MGLFGFIALQGLLELLTFANYTEISGAVGFGQRVVRLGLYAYFILMIAWRATHHKEVPKSFTPREFALLILIYIELFCVLILGALNQEGRSDTTFEDTRQLIELMILIAFVYSSIIRTEQIRKAIEWFISLLMVISGLNLLGYLGNFLFPSFPYFRSYFPLVLLFGCAIKWGQILIFGPSLRRIIQFVIICGGTLITFEKSILVPTLVGLASMIVLGLVSSSRKPFDGTQLQVGRAKIILTVMLVFVFLSVLVIATNAMTSNELFLRYQDLFIHRYLKEGYGDTGLDANRFAIWQTAWDEIMKNPVLGTGWGFRVDTWYRNSVYIHNFFLYWLGSVGFVGGGVLVFALFSVGRYILRNLDLSKDTDIKMGVGGFLVGVVVFNNTSVLFVEPAFVYVTSIAIAFILRMATLDANN